LEPYTGWVKVEEGGEEEAERGEVKREPGG